MTSRLMRSVKKRSQASMGSAESGGATTFFAAVPLDYSALLELYKTSKRHQSNPGGAPPSAAEAPAEFMNDAGEDAALPVLLYAARWCPARTTRREALDVGRSLLRPASSFNLKAIYMVVRALVGMEGEGEGEEPASRGRLERRLQRAPCHADPH